MVCLALLAAIELSMHSDVLLYRYRSVFAVGRAMDKLRYVEHFEPAFLIAGNSRVDNGFDPDTLLGPDASARGLSAFNLGIPGANARIFHGMLTRLERAGKLGPQKIGKVLIGLDESFLQTDDSLGYSVFFADRRALWRQHAYLDWLRSWLRLWGYGAHFKEMREPEKLLRFLDASRRQIEPVGGGAAERRGYRPGFGGKFQDAEQISRQEAGSRQPPDAETLYYFWEAIRLLQRNKVDIAVVFPPMLHRDVAYLVDEAWATPYRNIRNELTALQIPQIALESGMHRNPKEFVNAGHLNDQGAQRYTALLRAQLSHSWPQLIGHAAP